MANVRLLRQLVQDYQNRVEKVNETYQGERSIYEKAVEGYNAQIDAVKSGATSYVGAASGTPTGWGLFGGTDKSGNLAYQSAVRIVDSPNKMPTRYQPDEKVLVKSGDRLQEYSAKVVDPRYLTYKWSATGNYYDYLPDPSKLPVAPEMGDPGRLNLTEKEKGLLQNPTLGPSEMNMAAARGVAAQSSLAGDTPSTANSAFANPEDPNNLKEKGVLARVLGGQL